MPRRCSGAAVGDSPRGPLNNRGNPPHLIKSAKSNLIHEPKSAHTTRSQPWWPPWPTRATRLSAPSGEVRPARGLRAASGEVRPARGLSAPSGEVRPTRGLSVPSGEVRLARGSPHLLACPSHLML
jgi:hypothetical protein